MASSALYFLCAGWNYMVYVSTLGEWEEMSRTNRNSPLTANEFLNHLKSSVVISSFWSVAICLEPAV